MTNANATGSDHPTWSYNHENQTLTLNNYFGGSLYERAVIYADEDLTINLVGTNTVTASDQEEFGIFLKHGNLTITGSGVLNVHDNYHGIYVYGTKNDIIVNSGSIVAENNLSTGLCAIRNIFINGGSVDVKDCDDGIESTRVEISDSVDHVSVAAKHWAYYGKLANAIAGTGWKNTEGTGEGTPVEVSSEARMITGYRKLVFPANLGLATVTTAPAAKDLVYTGSAQELVTAGQAEHGTMQYALGTNQSTAPKDWSGSIPEGLEAGTYYVWYKAKADEDYNDSTPVCVPVKISREFTVTFQNGIGETLKTETVKEGAAATAPADPVREGYAFDGWDTDFSNVRSDLTVTARWKQVVVSHQVTFEDGLGNVLDIQTVVDGRPATAPADPSRDGYVFSGWDTDFSSVTKDLTVKALWTADSGEEGKYTVVFVLGFGHDPVVRTVEKGGAATAPEVPEVEGFEFTGWDKVYTNITDNLTVTAQWKKKSAGKEHTVVFVDGYSGKPPIRIQRVKDGGSATPPEAPVREGYTFDGWDTDFSYVIKNLTVIAQWKQAYIPPVPTPEPTLTPALTPAPTATPVPTPTTKPVPKTGDGEPLALWIGLVFLGLLCAGGMIRLTRKRG